MRRTPWHGSARSGGIALPIVLLMLMAALLLGMTAARLVQIDAQAARNGWDREIAFQAAEAALIDAERDIAGAVDQGRAALFRAEPFAADTSTVFLPGCGRGESNRALGLCQASAWRGLVDVQVNAKLQDDAHEDDENQDAALAGWVSYGRFTGQHMPQGGAGLPARLPRYIVEVLPDRTPGAAADSGGLRSVHRITALGFGTRDSTRVVLQSLYRKPSPALAGGGTSAADLAAPDAVFAAMADAAGAHAHAAPASTEPDGEAACARPGDPDNPTSTVPPLRIDVTGSDGVQRRLLITAAADGAPGIVARNAEHPDQVVFTFDARDDPAVLPLRQPLSSARWRVGSTAHRQFLAMPGAGHLFLLALDQPPGQAWVAGRNYHKLALTPDGADTVSSEAALSAPALAPGNDGAIRHAYVGDAAGRLWRLDFDDGWQQRPPPPTPLFAAADAQGRAQAVQLRPALAFAAHGYLVLFGAAGGIGHSAAEDAAATDTFYAIHDHLRQPGTAMRAQLAPRLLRETATARQVLGATFQYGLDADAVRGWYLDLPVPERISSSPSIMNGVLSFQTWSPDPDGCGAGMTRRYLLESLSGLQLAGHDAVRVLPSSSPAPLFSAQGQAQVHEAVSSKAFQLPPESHSISVIQEQEMQAESADQTDQIREPPSGRLGWREIIIQ